MTNVAPASDTPIQGDVATRAPGDPAGEREPEPAPGADAVGGAGLEEAVGRGGVHARTVVLHAERDEARPRAVGGGDRHPLGDAQGVVEHRPEDPEDDLDGHVEHQVVGQVDLEPGVGLLQEHGAGKEPACGAAAGAPSVWRRAISSRTVIVAAIARHPARTSATSSRSCGSRSGRIDISSAVAWIAVSGVRSSCASSEVSRCSARIVLATLSSRSSSVWPSARISSVGAPRSNLRSRSCSLHSRAVVRHRLRPAPAPDG